MIRKSRMYRKLLPALAVMLSICFFLALMPAVAALPYGVTNNVLTDQVTQGSDGSYKTGKIIVRFVCGTPASFQSLTQVYMLKSGKYALYLEIIAPDGKTVVSVGPQNVNAQNDNWIHSQVTRWRATFNKAGTYQFTIRIGKDVIGQYPIIVTD